MLINHYLAVIDYKAHEHYGFFSEFSTATHSHLFSSAGVLQPCCVQTLVAVVSFACLAKNSVMVYLLTAHHY